MHDGQGPEQVGHSGEVRQWGEVGGGDTGSGVALAAVASAPAAMESQNHGVMESWSQVHMVWIMESWSHRIMESWSDGGHGSRESESLCHGLSSSSSGLSHHNRHMVCHIFIINS